MTHHRTRGTSLVEVMIALSVLAVGMLGVVRGTVVVSEQNALARKRTVAQELANELAQYLRTRPYSDPLLTCSMGAGCAAPAAWPTISVDAAGVATFTSVNNPHVEGDLLTANQLTKLSNFQAIQDANGGTMSSARYWRTWHVSEPHAGLKAISVFVFYDDGMGGQQRVAQQTATFDSALLASGSTGVQMY